MREVRSLPEGHTPSLDDGKPYDKAQQINDLLRSEYEINSQNLYSSYVEDHVHRQK